MRHLKHHSQLGRKQEHRKALMANLASQLFIHEKIKTTLIKAKALRPFSEKIITLAKNAALTDKLEKKLHYRRLAIARVHNKEAVKKLFDDLVTRFLNRNGGYTRICKLMSRIGDGAQMGLIQLVEAPSEKVTRRRSVLKKAEQVKRLDPKMGNKMKVGGDQKLEVNQEIASVVEVEDNREQRTDSDIDAHLNSTDK